MHAARDLGLAEKVIQYIVYNTSKLSSDRITGEDGGQEDYGDTWVGSCQNNIAAMGFALNVGRDRGRKTRLEYDFHLTIQQCFIYIDQGVCTFNRGQQNHSNSCRYLSG